MPEIILEQPKKPDIFSFGFDKNLTRTGPRSESGVVYDAIESATNAGQILSGGNLTAKTISVGSLTRQVAPGDDIQAAIDAVNREGGGTVQLLAQTYLMRSDINLKSNVTLAGAGRGTTVIDFEGRALGIIVEGTSSSIMQNVVIRDMTIQNSNSPAGLNIDFADFWLVQNVIVTSCDQNGIRIRRSQQYSFVNVSSTSNTTNGFLWSQSTIPANRVHDTFQLLNCVASSNSSRGFDISVTNSTNPVENFTLINCSAKSNTSDGFRYTSTVGIAANARIVGGSFSSNGANGVTIESNVRFLNIVGANANSNTTDGFNIAGSNIVLIGCLGDVLNVVLDFDITGDQSVMVGCGFSTSIGNATSSFVNVSSTIAANIVGNQQFSPRLNRKCVRMRNRSGGTVPVGALIVWSTSSLEVGESFSTTTTNGDDLVVGMALESIANLSVGNILVEGYTTQLLVTNGVSSIVIGDQLSSYSHAYFAKEAIAGETVFAIALSSPTTSTAAITAILFSPRLI